MVSVSVPAALKESVPPDWMSAALEEPMPVRSSVRPEAAERVMPPAEVRRAPAPRVMELPKATPSARPKWSSPAETVSALV